MKQLTLIVFLAIAVPFSMASKNKDKPTLLVGFYGGINFTQPTAITSHHVNTSLFGNPTYYGKEYNSTGSNIGNQFGFVMFYPAFGNLHVGLLPSYSGYKYTYKTQQNWNETSGATLLNTTEHTQKLRYFEIPAVVRYYIGTAKVKPYVEGIISYGLLLNANKTADTEYTRTNGSYSSVVQNTSLKSDYSNSYIKSKFDIGFGGGISYDFNQIIIMLGASYTQGLHHINNEKNRYANDLFVGSTYDVQDNLNLNAIKVNLSLVFPINKITKRSEVECNYFRKSRKK
ncbi:porin family protein [Labilibacter marinus]|uniref:outer membrane beta-barrel protein n=1 Tax=Labilibacter marinus TaxID=1477105 RepID=UPI0009501B7D|nr:outer membrane beta-barrel protein [Labilibacter marinus]